MKVCPDSRVETRVGVLTESGLLEASDCNSQIEGSPFDGPCLWPDLESAQDANDEYGGLAEDCEYCQVVLTINKIELDKDEESLPLEEGLPQGYGG